MAKNSTIKPDTTTSAVSYTHLDVYKRQAYVSAFRTHNSEVYLRKMRVIYLKKWHCNRTGFYFDGFASAGFFVKAFAPYFYGRINRRKLLNGTRTVSYTHLDVYKRQALLFAGATILSTALFLPGVQSNSIALSAKSAFDIPVEITGAAVTALLALIIFGGVKRIGQVAEVVVPFMAGAYILMACLLYTSRCV